MAKKPIFQRLFLSYLWITVAAVVLVGVSTDRMMRGFYLDQTAEDLEIRARLCAKEIAEDLKRGDSRAVDAHCKDWGQAIDTRITVILPTGEVIGDTDEDPSVMVNHKRRPEIRKAMQGNVGRATHYSETLKEERMYLAVATDGGDPPAAVVRTSIPVTAINEALGAVHQKIILAGLVATGLIAAVSLWISLWIARPLEQMKRAAQRFARGELEYRLPDGDSEEISKLAEALNRMADQLSHRVPPAGPQS